MSSTVFSYEYEVDSRDADDQDMLKPSALMGYLQETATKAAEELKIGREVTVKKYGAVWILGKAWYHLEEPLRYRDRFTVETWHRGGQSITMYRDFDILRDGKRIGEATEVWVLLNLETGKMMKFSEIEECTPENSGGERNKSIRLSPIRMPENTVPADRRVCRYNELDLNHHVNNTRYADFLCDALHLENRETGRFVSEMQLNYQKECRAGEEIFLRKAEKDGLNFLEITDGEGVQRFQGTVRIHS